MIQIQKLTKTYQTPSEAVRVLDGLDLVINDGEAVAVVGPSGSGKTTLLNLLGAMDRPDSGGIHIGGVDIAGFSEDEAGRFRNRSIGFIFQQHHLLPQLNVLENVLGSTGAPGLSTPVRFAYNIHWGKSAFESIGFAYVS